MKPKELPYYDGYDDPAYCNFCGMELIVKATTFRGYNAYSGDGMVWCKVVCPNKKHWWDRHISRKRDDSSNRFFFFTKQEVKHETRSE